MFSILCAFAEFSKLGKDSNAISCEFYWLGLRNHEFIAMGAIRENLQGKTHA